MGGNPNKIQLYHVGVSGMLPLRNPCVILLLHDLSNEPCFARGFSNATNFCTRCCKLDMLIQLNLKQKRLLNLGTRNTSRRHTSTTFCAVKKHSHKFVWHVYLHHGARHRYCISRSGLNTSMISMFSLQ